MQKVNFQYTFVAGENNGDWLGRAPQFGITVHAESSNAARNRVSLAVAHLGAQLGERFGFQGAVEYLEKRGIKYELVSQPVAVAERELELAAAWTA